MKIGPPEAMIQFFWDLAVTVTPFFPAYYLLWHAKLYRVKHWFCLSTN